MNESIEKAASFWGQDRHPDEMRYHWLNHPVTRAHINERVSGNPNVSSFEYWREIFFPEKLGSVLSLGCGFGAFERHLVSSGAVDHVVGMDVSRGAIEGARLAAQKQGLEKKIQYQVADLNTIALERSSFDAIFGISSVHHIENLEHVFETCQHALKPGAMFFLNEYIGPTKWQYDDKVYALMNEIIAILPTRLRRVFWEKETVRTEAWRPSLSWFDDVDPSESVRSADIVPVLKNYFNVVDFRPYGGAIMHILLSGIAGNFMEDREEDIALLRMIALLEDTLERDGLIQTDFAAIVSSPKGTLT